MKGTIITCLQDLVTSQFGKEKWEESVKGAGMDIYTNFLPIADVEDAVVVKLLESVCKTLGITVTQAADAFGDYWVNEYSQKLYSHYYRIHKTAADFLLDMDRVHVQMTKSMENATPPRFDYEWKDDKTLLMHYKSPRGLVDVMAGLVRGVGKFYSEDLGVTKVDEKTVQIVFE